MSDERDYTAGDPIPVDDFVIGGDAVMDTDAGEAEANNVGGDLPPGVHLLRVAGFGKKLEKLLKKTNFAGKPVTYEAFQVSVRLVDSNNTGSIWQKLLLPPDNKTYLAYYNHGTNENGKAEGFLSAIFAQFIGRLIPGAIEKNKPLSPAARNLKNWVGRQVWAVVEMDKGGYVKQGINPETDEPYEPTEPRPQVKLFSYREFVEGGPCPYAAQQPAKAASKAKTAAKTSQPVGVGASANGTGHAAEDDGLADI